MLLVDEEQGGPNRPISLFRFCSKRIFISSLKNDAWDILNLDQSITFVVEKEEVRDARLTHETELRPSRRDLVRCFYSIATPKNMLLKQTISSSI